MEKIVRDSVAMERRPNAGMIQFVKSFFPIQEEQQTVSVAAFKKSDDPPEAVNWLGRAVAGAKPELEVAQYGVKPCFQTCAIDESINFVPRVQQGDRAIVGGIPRVSLLKKAYDACMC